mmetsp:Transcript_76837/g.207292  ORF Transcript_76837/g.207292 Transcript_76837/m.207292 type:complete len:242 (-) Transcript_76837:76-801(-)
MSMGTPRSNQNSSFSVSQRSSENSYRITRQASSPSMGEKELFNFDKWVCNVMVKIIQVVGEARFLPPLPISGETQKRHDFFLETRIIKEIEDDLQAWTERGFPAHPLVLFICADPASDMAPSPRVQPGHRQGPDKRYRVLEIWTIRYEPIPGQSARSREIKASVFVKQLVLLVRSVHSCLRMLPCHQAVAKHGCKDPSAGLKYRLSTSTQLLDTEEAADASHEYRFGHVDNPFGRIMVQVI